MSRSIAQIKEHLLATRFCVETNIEPVALYQGGKHPGDECLPADKREDFCLECLLRALRVGDRAGLLSRVNYYFPKNAAVPVKTAFHHAEMLNHLLVHSRVFVVQDIDGDRSYSLRMDTLLKGDYTQENIAHFFDEVVQDVAILLQYFGHATRPPSGYTVNQSAEKTGACSIKIVRSI